MKVYVGGDVISGLMHAVSVTPISVLDINQVPCLVREDDCALLGDEGYVINKLKRLARGAGLLCGVSLKAGKQHLLTEASKPFDHNMSSGRVRVEHAFRIIKRKVGCTKVRYNEVAKNAVQVFPLIGLANLNLAGRALMS